MHSARFLGYTALAIFPTPLERLEPRLTAEIGRSLEDLDQARRLQRVGLWRQ